MSLPEPSTPPPAAGSAAPPLRCGDRDREAVAARLADAYTEGRLDHDEHAERLEATWRARTVDELAALTADLGPVPLPAPSRRTAVVVDPRDASTSPDQLVSVLGSTRRDGSWRLRRRTTGLVLMGGVRLDLTQAVLEGQECIIQLPVLLGDVVIIVPEGVAVRDETTNVLGEVKLRGLLPTPPDAPTVVLRGLVLMGEVKVNGPAHQPWWRARMRPPGP